MIIIIDLDQHCAVQSFASQQQLSTPIQVKSQDTPSLHIYFVRAGLTYNLGASIGLKFGLFQAGNPNPLVQQLTFVQMQDPAQRTVYIGYPAFNTTAMQQAIGSQPSLTCVAEIRYQLSSGQVIHVLDIPFTITRTLMSENAIDATTAAFTTPAVNANVNVLIGNTGWLSVGLLVNIVGAGQYKVISITNPTQFVAQNTGITGNAAPNTVIASGAVVGIAGPSVIQTYPDPSIIEVTTHKNQPNGYAGLDGSGDLASAVIPVDGSSISLNPAGDLRIGYVIDTVQTAFTTPAAIETVNVNVVNSANFKVNDWVYIPIAGYYQVTALVDGTHITLKNLGDTWNALAGATIAIGAVLLPQTSLGSGGGGSAGQNAFSNTTVSFVAPAVSATVPVTMGSTAWLGGAGYVVYINGAGYYAVSSITSTTVAVLTNLGYAGNVTAGTTVGSGALVTPGGLAGTSGAAGVAGASAYDTTTASFLMPAAAASVNVAINNTSWLGVGQVVYIAGAGYLSVASLVSGTTFSATNLNYIGNASSGATIASGAKVSPGGLVGAQGAGGAGLNAFTTLSASFTQPAVGSSVTVNVGTTAWMALGQVVFIAGGGYYTVASVADLTHVSLTNLGYPGNAGSGSTVSATGSPTVSPAGLIGQAGNAYTTTTAGFTMPASGSTVSLIVGNTAWLAQGQNVYVQGAGYFSVSVVVDATHVALINLGAPGNVSPGSVVASGAGVVAAGATGQTGPAGPVGASGSALINSALSVQGTGAVAAPVQLVGDNATPGNSMLYGTDASGNKGWQPAGGGGGGLDPQSAFNWFDDFVRYTATDYGQVANGTAIVCDNYGQDSTRKFVGSLSLGTGTGSSGTIMDGICLGSYNNALVSIFPGLGPLTLKWRVAFPTPLPGTGAGYEARFGWGAGAGGAGLSSTWWNPTNMTQQAFFEYSPDNNSGQWRVSTGTTTANYANSSVAVAADTSYDLELDVNAAANQYTFKINGVTVATIGPTNLPTGAFYPFAFIYRNVSPATAWLMKLDYLYVNYLFSR
jgi:hypothetical protein